MKWCAFVILLQSFMAQVYTAFKVLGSEFTDLNSLPIYVHYVYLATLIDEFLIFSLSSSMIKTVKTYDTADLHI